MLLQHISIQNVGPIENFQLDLPFRDGRPLPLILVGPNGSGKSTLLSFVVNALVGFKQQAFLEAEVEHSQVYRIRSPQYIRGGASWYHVHLRFEDDLALEEWVLDRPRKSFEAEVQPLPAADGWKRIKESKTSDYQLTPHPRHPAFGGVSLDVSRKFNGRVVLYFPSDRFESPAWLNEQSLATALRFAEPASFEDQTPRRIFSRTQLRPTLEWIKSLILDSFLGNQQAKYITKLIGQFLGRIVGSDSDGVCFRIGSRTEGTVGAEWVCRGRAEYVLDLMSLSAGQSALFCLFCNILRDFDLAGATFQTPADIRGIVLIDEADLHLYVDHQLRVLPGLMALFPNVQFILTAHAPLLAMGMREQFSPDGFRVLEMPAGRQIDAEEFSEFDHAFAAFTQTRAFDQRVMSRVVQAQQPVVLTEGKSDVLHIVTAWEKLHPGQPLPWYVTSCGEGDKGGAKPLKVLLEAISRYCDRPVAGVFDYDQEGAEQYGGLASYGFQDVMPRAHRSHKDRPVHALLLPVPPGREHFVNQRERSCFLSIEHFYSDDLLQQHGLADEPVVTGSPVFGIVPKSDKKMRFARSATDFPPEVFINFNLLFDALATVVARGGRHSDGHHRCGSPVGQHSGVHVLTFFDSSPAGGRTG